LGYASSIGRYNLAEVSPNYVEDVLSAATYKGNPGLRQVKIKNYEAKIEGYFADNNNLSVAGFYKEFYGHIEIVATQQNSWVNSESVNKMYGVEFEGRKSLFSVLELSGNVTLVKSENNALAYASETLGGEVITKRPMFGQAPYIVNGMLSYAGKKNGLMASVAYNVQGPSLVKVTVSVFHPDIYVMPRHVIDAKITKRFGKHITAEFKVRDLLGTPVVWMYENRDDIKDHRRLKFGASYSFAMQFDL
jgi:outer membrane receptor protein involved in Fe transport